MNSNPAGDDIRGLMEFQTEINPVSNPWEISWVGDAAEFGTHWTEICCVYNEGRLLPKAFVCFLVWISNKKEMKGFCLKKKKVIGRNDSLDLTHFLCCILLYSTSCFHPPGLPHCCDLTSGKDALDIVWLQSIAAHHSVGQHMLFGCSGNLFLPVAFTIGLSCPVD